MEVSMSLVRTNGDLTPRLPALFNDFFNRDLFDWNLSNFFNAGTALPSVNIWETGDAFEVEMAAPGMRKQDFKVQLDGNTLSISSERREEETVNGRNYTRKEFGYQAFHRSFVLPKDVVDEKKIKARYENGVLHLVVPKREEARKKPRLIKIS